MTSLFRTRTCSMGGPRPGLSTRRRATVAALTVGWSAVGVGFALAGCGGPGSGAAPSSTPAGRPSAVDGSRPATSLSTVSVPSTAPNAVTAGKSGLPRGAVATVVKDTDPSSVAAAVAIASWTWDTRIDHSPQDARRRAAKLMTRSAAAVQDEAVTAGGGADWNALAARDGYTVATSVADSEPPPPDVGGQAARRLFVTVTPHPSTTAMPVEHWTVVVELQRSSGGAWRARSVGAQPTDGAAGGTS